MDLAFPAEFRIKNLEHVAPSVALNAKGDRLAIGLAMGNSKGPSLQILDVASGDVLSGHAPAMEICRAVAFGSDNALYFLADDRREIKLSQLSGLGRQIETIAGFPSDALMNNLVCDRAGKLLAVAGRRVEVRRLPDGAVIRTFDAAEPEKELASCFSDDGRSIYIYGAVKGHIVKVDLGTGEETGRWAGPTDYGLAVAISSGGKYLAALGQFKGLFLYDTATGERISPRTLKARTVAGPPVFIRDELMVAPPEALNLTSMEGVMMPLYPPGNIIATAVATDAPMIAFSHREGALIWGRLQ